MVLDIFRDSLKLLNKKVVPLYLWFFVYCFITSIEDNFFICSYLRDEVFGKDENTVLVLVFYIAHSFISFYINRLRNTNENELTLYANNLLVEIVTWRYKYYILKITSFSHILFFNFKKFFLFNIFLLNNYKSYKINTFIIYIFNILNLNSIIWYPIFKTYSIFGYYKSTRLNFIDIKNENLKRLKY